MKKAEEYQSARDAIMQALAADKMRTAAELAEIGNCSRQRVHQILKTEGFRLPHLMMVAKARGAQAISRANTAGAIVRISHTTVGTISELLVAADLMTRGWLVFFPLVRTTKCDLIAMSVDGSVLKRIEVRSSRKSKVGTTVPVVYQQDVCDHHAYVLKDSPVEYAPPI